MGRKILAYTLMILSSILILVSLAGLIAAWIYNEPLTSDVTQRLQNIDDELELAQTTLDSTHTELERALRLVDTAQAALEQLAEQSTSAESLFDGIQSSLDDRLLPELKATREKLETARQSLESLQSLIQGIGSLPFVNVSVPEQLLGDLIDSTDTIDAEIANAEEVARQASTFVSDTSYLLGGDLTETRDSLQNFLTAVEEYQTKVEDWRTQIAALIDRTPAWIDRASWGLTVFLFWFGLSQFGLLLHGRMILLGENPLDVLRA
jgi:F0F1-type ATP synthase membrane subunit b/b'